MKETLQYLFLESNFSLLDFIVTYIIARILTGGFNEKD